MNKKFQEIPDGWKLKNKNPLKIKKEEYKIEENEKEIIVKKNGKKVDSQEYNSEEEKIGSFKALAFAIDKNRI